MVGRFGSGFGERDAAGRLWATSNQRSVPTLGVGRTASGQGRASGRAPLPVRAHQGAGSGSDAQKLSSRLGGTC